MDTDFLTPMARDCIRLANEAIDTLSSELGAACSQYHSEDDYLRGILDDVKEIEEDPREYLDWWNVLDKTDIAAFQDHIRILRNHIDNTIHTPLQERGTLPG
ncbi:MAG: hypothetical protein ACI9QL_003896 [Candidatus Omnitrophota bacterium]|jgi:flagellar biosynthesis chaperone FliJ